MELDRHVAGSVEGMRFRLEEEVRRKAECFARALRTMEEGKVEGDGKKKRPPMLEYQ